MVIQRHAIARQRPGCTIRLLRFGERSGAVMLQVGGMGLVQIDSGLQLCLHETDQPTLFESVIKNMKHF